MLNYTDMTRQEIRDVIADLVLEIKKAAVADDLELAILVNGTGEHSWTRIIDMEKGVML